MDERVGGWLDGWADRQGGGLTDGWTDMDGWNDWTGEPVDGRESARANGWVGGWTGGGLD